MDIIEIKKPPVDLSKSNGLLRKNKQRDNYIPSLDLTGAIMQTEKYLFHLNRWGKEGEKFLNNKYKKEIGSDVKLKIINPKGLIIMGRSNQLAAEQKLDFEIIKRKYVNIVDIITYDDLLYRLDRIIDKFKPSKQS